MQANRPLRMTWRMQYLGRKTVQSHMRPIGQPLVRRRRLRRGDAEPSSLLPIIASRGRSFSFKKSVPPSAASASAPRHVVNVRMGHQNLLQLQPKIG